MKKTIVFMMAFAISLMAPAGANALEADWGTKRGDWELNVVGNIESNKVSGEDITFSNTRIQTTVGYFLTDAIETGITLYLGSSTSDIYGEKTTTTNTKPVLFAAYHFNMQGNMTPFAGVAIGSASNKEEAGQTTTWTEFSYGLMGGVKYFVSEWAAIVGQVNYDMRTLKFTESGNSFDASQFGLNFGLTLFF